MCEDHLFLEDFEEQILNQNHLSYNCESIDLLAAELDLTSITNPNTSQCTYTYIVMLVLDFMTS